MLAVQEVDDDLDNDAAHDFATLLFPFLSARQRAER